MKNVMALLVLLLLCVDGWGCMAHNPLDNEWCETHRCDYVERAVDSGNHPHVATALENLNAASGLDLVEDETGVPVYFVPQTYDLKGAEVCGVTYITRSGSSGAMLSMEVEVALAPTLDCAPLWMVIRHEIACHVLTEGKSHTESGMCAPHGGGALEPDQVSLEFMLGR